MTSIKIKFRGSSNMGREGSIVYRIIHNRRVSLITTGYKLYVSEWDEKSSEILLLCPGGKRIDYLLGLKAAIANDLSRLESIVTNLENMRREYTSEMVASIFYRHECAIKYSLTAFGVSIANELYSAGKIRTAETYMSAIRSFKRFWGVGMEVSFDDINSDIIMKYEKYLRSNGLCANSISFYMRNLRAIYNRAVEGGLTVQRKPFKHVYTGVCKTMKRAVSVEVIRKIRDCSLDGKKSLCFARDMFMFSFYTRGMSFVDMSFLRKKDLQNGLLVYRRRKTSQLLVIKWERPMQAIVKKYEKEDSPYLLPIIRDPHGDLLRQYRSMAHFVNENLRTLGSMLRISTRLTMYVARHTWASTARTKNIPLSVISEAMGHDSEDTTRIYLAALDSTLVDKANRAVMASL